jgi:hypothetical protein
VPVDVGRWIDELRSGNFGEYVEKQKRFVQKERASIVQGVLIDGLTAVFLLAGKSVTSTTGKDVVSRFRKMFINFEDSNICLSSVVCNLVPLLQSICSFSLSARNLTSVAEALMGLAFKERASSTWVRSVLTRAMGTAKVVNNQNIGGLIKFLGDEQPPERQVGVRNKRDTQTIVEVSPKAVCINRRIVRKHVWVWVFVCARRRQARAPSQKLFETKRPILPAVPATRSLPKHRFERFL